MFKKNKDNEVDIASLNTILRTGKRLINIGYFVAVVCLVLLGTYLIKEWKILKYVGEFLRVISPIFIGFVIAWLFDPLVSKLQKQKIPRIVGTILVYLLIIGALVLISCLFVPALISQVKDFVKEAPRIFDEISSFIMNFLNNFGIDEFTDIEDLKSNIVNYISDFGLEIGSNIPKYLFSVGKSVVSGGLNFILGLMIGFYLLFDFEKANKIVQTLIPVAWKDGYHELTKRVNTSLRSYIQGVLLVMLLVFVTQVIGLTLAGMPSPIVFALFCAITDVIPYFGPYIGAIPAIIVGFTVSPVTGICVIISILVVQLLENNFYQPIIMGHTMKLHPVTIMLGLLIFGHFFGILGMVVATPCIACIKVIAVFILEKTGYIKYLRGDTRKELKKEKLL